MHCFALLFTGPCRIVLTRLFCVSGWHTTSAPRFQRLSGDVHLGRRQTGLPEWAFRKRDPRCSVFEELALSIRVGTLWHYGSCLGPSDPVLPDSTWSHGLVCDCCIRTKNDPMTQLHTCLCLFCQFVGSHHRPPVASPILLSITTRSECIDQCRSGPRVLPQLEQTMVRPCAAWQNKMHRSKGRSENRMSLEHRRSMGFCFCYVHCTVFVRWCFIFSFLQSMHSVI